MTEDECLAWIDEASSDVLWLLFYCEPFPSPWFVGNVGVRIMNKLVMLHGTEFVFSECRKLKEVPHEHT